MGCAGRGRRLWGAFGSLWTERRGIVQMYVSRVDEFVWIELRQARPSLITPERPEMFVRALGGERVSPRGGGSTTHEIRANSSP